MTDENTKPEEVVELDQDEELRKMEYERVSPLEPSLYWEWRATIEELNTAKSEEKCKMLEAKILQMDVENKKLQLKLYTTKTKDASDKRKNCEEECKRMKGKLEESIGFSLENCVIDDINFEVKKLSE